MQTVTRENVNDDRDNDHGEDIVNKKKIGTDDDRPMTRYHQQQYDNTTMEASSIELMDTSIPSHNGYAGRRTATVITSTSDFNTDADQKMNETTTSSSCPESTVPYVAMEAA